MGNSSSLKKQPQKHKQLKNFKQKKQTFCCLCSTKSSSSLSISIDNYLPTFDRIVEKKTSYSSNNKNNQKNYSDYYVEVNQPIKSTNEIIQPLAVKISKQDQSISENSSTICTPALSLVNNTDNVKDDNNSLTTSSTSTSHNRRSLSLDNVVVTPNLNRNTDNHDGDGVFKIPQLPARPPLPIGTPSTTITQSRSHHFSSFRLPLVNTKRTYYSQSIEQAKSSIEDLEKSLQGCQSIDKWIDSLSILGTPSLNRVNKQRTITTPLSQQRQKKRTSTTVNDELFIIHQKNAQNQILCNEQPKSSVINDFVEELPSLLVSSTKSNLEVLHLAKCIGLNLLTLNNYLKDFLFRLLYYQQILYKQRLKSLPSSSCNNKKSVRNHFSQPVMIYPSIDNNTTQISTILADDLYVEFVYPLEFILPILSTSSYSTYNIQEQIRSRCYFIPKACFNTLPEDDDYRHKQEIEQTSSIHVVIELETGSGNTSSKTTKSQQIDDPSCLFICDENDHSSFYTGHIRLHKSYWKQYAHFSYRALNDEENNYYLSSYAFQQWFQSLIIINQTCSIANRFLTGDGSYLTCLLKPKTSMTKIELPESNENIENSNPSLQNHIMKKECNTKQNISAIEDQYHIQLVCLRLPPTLFLLDSSNDQENNVNNHNETNELNTKLSYIHAFSDVFLSNNKNSETFINVDYEQYVLAIPLLKWPKYVLDNYYHKRSSKRKWPSTYHMNIIVKKQLLLIPKSNCKINLSQSNNNHQLDDRWQLNFDLVENLLYEYMNESTLFLYTFSLQLFSLTKKLNGINYSDECHNFKNENEYDEQNDEYAIRLCIKHCFLNYCEKYGLPFSTSTSSHQRTNDSILDLTHHFLKELHSNLKQNFLPHYFNHEYNILNIFSDNNNSNLFLKWFNHIQYCVLDRQKWFTLKLQSSNSLTSVYKPLIIEYMFYYIDQLYDEFHIKRKDMRFNELVLIELHEKLCEKLTNENGLIWTNDVMNNEVIRMKIQQQLANEFEQNAELVHTCLNQIRRAESSLIFHYTWTLYLQYLHSYFNCIWNLF